MTEFLFPTNTPLIKRPYAVIDIETKDGDTQKAGFTRPFLAGWYDEGSGYFQTSGPDCLSKMLAYACRQRHEGWCFYAHNGGGFDWLHFLPFLHKAGYYYEILTAGSTIQMLKVKPSKDSKHKGWTFLDSMKLIPMSLEKAAKSFGVALKLQVDLDMHESDPRWKEYLERDCLSTYQILQRYHELIEIRLAGEVGITAASTAMRTFRRGYQKGPIYRHTEHHSFFREAYYGGRVERFATNVSGVRVYDINSSYPHSMRQPQPVGVSQTWEGEPAPSMLRMHAQGDTVGFVRARVRVPNNTYIPTLPYRHNGKLMFPTGEFAGVWDWCELSHAISKGAYVLWYGESVWVETGYTFEAMVNAFYAYRDKSRPDYDEGLALVAKILLNSLYGKFGMREDRERLVRLNPLEDSIPDGARPTDPKNPNCDLWYISESAEADYVCPQIAAHVTSLSRVALTRFFEVAHEHGVLAYGDTDSIHTTADLDAFVSSELGGLKFEGTFDGEYLGPKLYMLTNNEGTKLTMKGFKPPKVEAEKLAYYERVKRGESVTFESVEKMGRLAARGFESGPRMLSISRSLKTEDGKRYMLSPETSRPVSVQELEMSEESDDD